MTALAFNNDQALKDRCLERLKKHRANGSLKKSTWWDASQSCGCAIACQLEAPGQWRDYEKLTNVPLSILYLHTRFFDNLDAPHHLDFAERFVTAIKPGADLSKVWAKFNAWLMTDDVWGVLRLAKRQDTKDAISDVGALFERLASGEAVPLADIEKTRDNARKARSAAAYAYASAAAAAAYAAASADADAAYASADAAAAAYAYAAYASADAADAADVYAAAASDAAYASADAAAAASDAARQKQWLAMSNKLVELLEAAT